VLFFTRNPEKGLLKNYRIVVIENISVLRTYKNLFFHSSYKDFATLWRGWKNGAEHQNLCSK
jgi:hypothetical protein